MSIINEEILLNFLYCGMKIIVLCRLSLTSVSLISEVYFSETSHVFRRNKDMNFNHSILRFTDKTETPPAFQTLSSLWTRYNSCRTSSVPQVRDTFNGRANSCRSLIVFHYCIPIARLIAWDWRTVRWTLYMRTLIGTKWFRLLYKISLIKSNFHIADPQNNGPLTDLFQIRV